ncbi:MAG: polysaccharide biosynthesis/export family protein [Gemmataceae bacterium]
MRGITKIRLILPALIVAITQSGCSTVGATLGFTPPVYKLTEPAKQLRASSGVHLELPRELAKTVLPAYVVEPGDVLLVTPVELDSPVRLPGDQTVLPDGTIDLGRYGRPVVAGKTVPQIEAEVQQLISARLKKEEQEFGQVQVRLVNRASKVFYVLGEVNGPGSFPLAGRETVLDGILAAGGLTRQASARNIILSRPTAPDGCRVVMAVCYNDIVQLGDTATNYQLQPGDRIYVPSQTMLESLFPNQKECGPCNRPQVGCGPGVACAPAGAAPVSGTAVAK